MVGVPTGVAIRIMGSLCGDLCVWGSPEVVPAGVASRIGGESVMPVGCLGTGVLLVICVV